MSLQFLDDLRKKSDYQKRVIAVSASAAITGLILIVWITVGSLNLAQTNIAEGGNDSPNASIKKSAKEAIASVSGPWSELKKAFKERFGVE